MAGETVGPQMTGVANVAEIADFNSIVVETDVPEARLDLIKAGSPAEIVLDAYPTRRYRGVAVDIGKRVNRAKATVIVKVKFKDTLEGVLPDMSARVSFLREELARGCAEGGAQEGRGAEAVTERDGGKVLFAIDERQAAHGPGASGRPGGQQRRAAGGARPRDPRGAQAEQRSVRRTEDQGREP